MKIVNKLTSLRIKAAMNAPAIFKNITRMFPIMFIRCLEDILTRMLYGRKMCWLVEVPAVRDTYFNIKFIILMLVKHNNGTAESFDDTIHVYQNESEGAPPDSSKNLECLHLSQLKQNRPIQD